MAGVGTVLERVDKLPAFPGTAAMLLQMLSADSWDVDDAERIIRNDESLSAAILRCANSAMFGSSSNTFNLHQSIIRLGARNLVSIAIEQSVAPVMKNRGSSYGMRRGALWRSSLGGALAARALARNVDDCPEELAYIAALMRDIGKLAFEQAYAEEFRTIIAPFLDDNKPFCAIEREAFGCDHSQLGHALALLWNLPEPIPSVILYHHNPPTPDHENHAVVIDVVHAADMLARWAGLGIGDDGMQYSIAEHVRTSLKLTARTIEKHVADIWVELDELQDQFGNSSNQEVAA
ncbi:MAG: HDOD domain-containing protein [Planctomycetota bacterium]|jgi:HD-like signal output (HDOD) protein